MNNFIRQFCKNMKKDDNRTGKMQTVGELINSSKFSEIINSNKINLIAKHSTIFSFWSDIVGRKFSNITYPLKIKASKLYVCAKSPVIVQELSLYKINLVKKINSYSMPLGIEIKDIVFDYKNYKKENANTDDFVEDKPENYDETFLDNINIDEAEIEKIKNHIFKIDFLNDTQKQLLLKKVIAAQNPKLARKLIK